MSWKIKIRILIFTLTALVVGSFPVFGSGVKAFEDGSIISLIYGGQNLVQLDPCGRLEGVLNSRGGLTTFLYDDAGNLSQRTAADLKVTEYGYNSLNQLVAITNENIEVATFDHDPNGNVISHRGTENTEVSFGYDEMNRITNSLISVHSRSFTVQNQYDLNGNRTNIVYPDGLTVGYEFGADNRLESVTTEYAENTESFIFEY